MNSYELTAYKNVKEVDLHNLDEILDALAVLEGNTNPVIRPIYLVWKSNDLVIEESLNDGDWFLTSGRTDRFMIGFNSHRDGHFSFSEYDSVDELPYRIFVDKSQKLPTFAKMSG